MANPG